jgi:hypothetical protein
VESEKQTVGLLERKGGEPKSAAPPLKNTLRYRLDGAPPCQQVDHEDHEGHNENQVNQAATNPADKPEQPEHQEHHQNCPQHIAFSFSSVSSFTITVRLNPTASPLSNAHASGRPWPSCASKSLIKRDLFGSPATLRRKVLNRLVWKHAVKLTRRVF